MQPVMNENAIPVLDKGFVELMDVMGNDSVVASAARVSHDGSVVRNNESLLRYLVRHGHHSPLEFAELHFRIKAPIFVARQIFRHRTANFSEKSGRYTGTFEEYYQPNYDRMNPDKGKQGSNEQRQVNEWEYCHNIIQDTNYDSFNSYDELKQKKISKEVARTILPLSTYTEFRFKSDLRNILHFLKLRLDSHAQYETRLYAEAISKFVKDCFPIIWSAFEDYELNSMKLSDKEIKILSYILFAVEFDYSVLPDYYFKELGMSGGERDEFLQKIKKLDPLRFKKNMENS